MHPITMCIYHQKAYLELSRVNDRERAKGRKTSEKSVWAEESLK